MLITYHASKKKGHHIGTDDALCTDDVVEAHATVYVHRTRVMLSCTCTAANRECTGIVQHCTTFHHPRCRDLGI